MNKKINKLLKPIKAFLAILLTIPAVYLPFRLQNVYKRMMSLLAYKLKNYNFIAKSVIIQEHNGETRDGKGK